MPRWPEPQNVDSEGRWEGLGPDRRGMGSLPKVAGVGWGWHAPRKVLVEPLSSGARRREIGCFISSFLELTSFA